MSQGDLFFTDIFTVSNDATQDIKPVGETTEWILKNLKWEAAGTVNVYRKNSDSDTLLFYSDSLNGGLYDISEEITSTNYITIENKSGGNIKCFGSGRINKD
jgi:hypothetical protein